MIRKSHWTAVAAAFIFALVTSSAHAVLIVGVDTATPSGGGIYTGAGILDTSSRTWHDADAGNFTLGTSSVSIDLDGAAGENIRGGGAITLFEEIRFKSSGDTDYTVTLSGLSNDAFYNVVVYGADRNGSRGTAYTVGGVTKSTTGDSSASFIDGTNYVRFDGVSATAGVLTIDLGNAGENIRQINGFEIQMIPHAPEPSTLVLAAMGLVGIAVGRRRRCRA